MFSKVSLETQGNQITVRVYEIKQTRKNKKKQVVYSIQWHKHSPKEEWETKEERLLKQN